MFNLMFALLGTYIFYKHGMGYLLKSRIMDTNKSEWIGYAMFMLAGIILGEFLGLTLAYQFASEWKELQIVSGTLSSILLGEAFYYYNKRVVRKIPTMEQRKNY